MKFKSKKQFSSAKVLRKSNVVIVDRRFSMKLPPENVFIFQKSEKNVYSFSNREEINSFYGEDFIYFTTIPDELVEKYQKSHLIALIVSGVSFYTLITCLAFIMCIFLSVNGSFIFSSDIERNYGIFIGIVFTLSLVSLHYLIHGGIMNKEVLDKRELEINSYIKSKVV
jgi:hypothetical protein